MKAHINPDHYLQTQRGRVWSEALGKQAWERAYADLDLALGKVGSAGVMYLVCGVQGAGKTRWIASNRSLLEERAIFFDAALPRRKHLRRALDLAAAHHTPAIAVWINVSLETALRQNLRRPLDEQVPRETILSVFEQIEPPTPEEGFVRVIEVTTAEK